MPEIVDPGDEWVRVWVATDENTRGSDAVWMNVPAPTAGPVVAAIRDAAAQRAGYCLNVALLKWQENPQDVPGLLERSTVDGVLTMAERAVEALRVLHELAPEVIATDEEADADA